jgi:hypothetical protein
MEERGGGIHSKLRRGTGEPKSLSKPRGEMRAQCFAKTFDLIGARLGIQLPFPIWPAWQLLFRPLTHTGKLPIRFRSDSDFAII